MRKFLLLLIMACLTTPLAAQQSGLNALENGFEARGWEGVGRLDIAGKGFCTGALIAPDLVLTAAHCLFEKAGGDEVDPERIEFQAGLRTGRAEASRFVRTAVIHPQYRHVTNPGPEIVRYDVALLQLNRPIRTYRIAPFEISQTILNGTEISVVSYAQDRAESASLQETCSVLGEQDGILIMDCDVNFGSSGAPIFRDENGVPRLVSVVSAMAELDGQKVSLGMDLAGPIADLRAALAENRSLFGAPPASARIIRGGERADTGALFVRP